MDNTAFNPEKKALPIVSILFSILALIDVAIAFILDNFFPNTLSSVAYIVVMVIGFVLILVGLFSAAFAVTKKCGTLKLARTAQMISIIAVLIIIIFCIVGNFI